MLISKEELQSKIADEIGKCHIKAFDTSVNVILQLIRNMPAADVQPVNHGYWENTNTPNQLRCSKCDVIHFIAQYPQGKINYCPNCGAIMDGDCN